MKGVKLLLNSPKNPAISDSLPYREEPSPCVVILGSPLSTVSLRFQDKSEIPWQEAAPQPVGRYYCPWDDRAGEVRTEPRGVCHLSLASSSTELYTFAQGCVSQSF